MRMLLCFIFFLMNSCAHRNLERSQAGSAELKDEILVFRNDVFDIDLYDISLQFYFSKAAVLSAISEIEKQKLDSERLEVYDAWKTNILAIKGAGFFVDHQTYGTADDILLSKLLMTAPGWMCCNLDNGFERTGDNLDIREIGSQKFFVIKRPTSFGTGKEKPLRIAPVR